MDLEIILLASFNAALTSRPSIFIKRSRVTDNRCSGLSGTIVLPVSISVGSTQLSPSLLFSFICVLAYTPILCQLKSTFRFQAETERQDAMLVLRQIGQQQHCCFVESPNL